jgi:hypothetical protein
MYLPLHIPFLEMSQHEHIQLAVSLYLDYSEYNFLSQSRENDVGLHGFYTINLIPITTNSANMIFEKIFELMIRARLVPARIPNATTGSAST